MNITDGLRAERLIAERYEDRGYVVTLGPPRSAIPFELRNYAPEISATKGDESLLIDVKPAGARTDLEFYFRVDQEVQRHPGWRFLLVTVSDAELEENASDIATNVDIEAIRDNLRDIGKVGDDPGMSGLVIRSLWMDYVSALRLLLLEWGEDGGIDCYNDYSLINKAYSDGVISFDEYECSRRLMKLRNQTEQSVEKSATPADCDLLRQMVRTQLDRLLIARTAADPGEKAKSM